MVLWTSIWEKKRGQRGQVSSKTSIKLWGADWEETKHRLPRQKWTGCAMGRGRYWGITRSVWERSHPETCGKGRVFTEERRTGVKTGHGAGSRREEKRESLITSVVCGCKKEEGKVSGQGEPGGDWERTSQSVHQLWMIERTIAKGGLGGKNPLSKINYQGTSWRALEPWKNLLSRSPKNRTRNREPWFKTLGAPSPLSSDRHCTGRGSSRYRLPAWHGFHCCITGKMKAKGKGKGLQGGDFWNARCPCRKKSPGVGKNLKES